MGSDSPKSLADSEPLTPEAAVEGRCYFIVHFLDDEMLVPELKPIVFIGFGLAREAAEDTLFFQDAGSYPAGIRFMGADSEVAEFHMQRPEQVGNVFEFERAVDLLQRCAAIRSRRGLI